jgi:site-specific DNA-methyltransferase (adenine-specific)
MFAEADFKRVVRNRWTFSEEYEMSIAYKTNTITPFNADALALYDSWDAPNVIISDGAYGVSGFKGDTHGASDLAAWYKPHIEAWSKRAAPGTTLWFWNTELGWATIHPLLQALGWDYAACNIWNKGIQHIAGNCNLSVLKSFPVVTEVCVQYVRRAEFCIEGKTASLKEWLRYEWERTGLPFSKTNEACGVANAATRKYFTKDHLWYAPPPEAFMRLVEYANANGAATAIPYFSFDGESLPTHNNYAALFATFNGQYGVTNVWDTPPLHGAERVRLASSSKYAHLNQKPLELMRRIIECSTLPDELVWEPFGGLCSASLAAQQLGRKALCSEIDATVYKHAVERLAKHSGNYAPPRNANGILNLFEHPLNVNPILQTTEESYGSV